jgi:hypothetical protein
MVVDQRECGDYQWIPRYTTNSRRLTALQRSGEQRDCATPNVRGLRWRYLEAAATVELVTQSHERGKTAVVEWHHTALRRECAPIDLIRQQTGVEEQTFRDTDLERSEPVAQSTTMIAPG